MFSGHTAYCNVPAACQQGQSLGKRDAVMTQVLFAHNIEHFGQQRQQCTVVLSKARTPAWLLQIPRGISGSSLGSQAVPHNLSCFLYKVGKDLSHFCMTHVKISSGFAILLKIREVENTRTSELLISNAGKNTPNGVKHEQTCEFLSSSMQPLSLSLM